MDKDQHQAKYDAEVKLAGDLVNQPPALRMEAQRMSTPSKGNGNRYQVKFKIYNLSRHPTEIELGYKIVGYTDNGNLLYEMSRGQQVLKLRRNESKEIDVWTPNVGRFKKPLQKYDPKKSTKVSYRGSIMTAKFKGKLINSFGSDGRMQRIASGENPASIPKI